MYRSKFWNRKQRIANKREKRHKWYTKGGYETVFFVEATPASALAKRCDTILKRAGLKIRVVEKAGMSMKRLLTKSDPFPHEKCANSNCAVCNRSDRINCKKRGVVYQINCQGNHDTPSGIYIGETARNISERMNKHLDKYKKKSQNSVFYQHMLEKHDGILHNLDLKLLASAPDDAMLRCCARWLKQSTSMIGPLIWTAKKNLAIPMSLGPEEGL